MLSAEILPSMQCVKFGKELLCLNSQDNYGNI